jgi:hypothetical protein
MQFENDAEKLGFRDLSLAGDVSHSIMRRECNTAWGFTRLAIRVEIERSGFELQMRGSNVASLDTLIMYLHT